MAIMCKAMEDMRNKAAREAEKMKAIRMARLMIEDGKLSYEIYRVACKYGCEYTVYVDDMTFSSKKPFDINQMKNEIDCILRKYGHKPKYKKVKYYSKGKSVPITGTIVTENHELKVPNRLQKRVYDDFQELKLFDRKELSDDEIKKLNSLKGRIQASRNIEEGKFPEINRLTNLIG